MAKIGLLLIAVVSFVAVGCENYDRDLYDQVSYKFQEYPAIAEPEGSVSMNEPREDYSEIDGVLLTNPYEGEKGLADKGKPLYETFCTPCHGMDGSTKNAPVADKFDPRPANLLIESVTALTEGEIFQRIVDGYGIMPSYRYELSDREAWEVTAYVLRLQGRE